MSYILCNGNNYFAQTHEKGMYIAHSVDEALKWRDIGKANNTLKTLPKQFRKYHLEAKFVYKNDNVLEKMNDNTDYDFYENLANMLDFIKRLEERKQYLIEEIKKVELEIVDIEHAAEFYNLNASQGYKIYKMLHEARNKRRILKDEEMRINMTLGTKLRKDSLDDLLSRINGMDNRKYSPRVNAELFNV